MYVCTIRWVIMYVCTIGWVQRDGVEVVSDGSVWLAPNINTVASCKGRKYLRHIDE